MQSENEQDPYNINDEKYYEYKLVGVVNHSGTAVIIEFFSIYF